MTETNDEPEIVQDLCPNCREVCAHTVDAEPALMTVHVLDCHGDWLPARVGLPIVRCVVCGTTSPQGAEAQKVVVEATRETVRRSFHAAMGWMERGRRKDVVAGAVAGTWMTSALWAMTSGPGHWAVIAMLGLFWCGGVLLLWVAMGRRWREVRDGE